MEDSCAACEDDWKQKKYHVDLWMGPQKSSTTSKLNSCEDFITRDSTAVVTNPTADLPVDTTPLYSNDACTAHVYGADGVIEQ